MALKKFESVKDLFNEFAKNPTEALEKQITKTILKTNWHLAMTGEYLDQIPKGKTSKTKKDETVSIICIPVLDDLIGVPFYESDRDLLKWFKAIKDNPDYVEPGHSVHDIVYKGKDIDMNDFSRNVKVLAFFAKGAKEPLYIMRKDFIAETKQK